MGAEEDAVRVVRQLCEGFAGHDAEALRPLFTDDIVYHNIPMDPAVGIDDTITFITGFFSMCESMPPWRSPAALLPTQTSCTPCDDLL